MKSDQMGGAMRVSVRLTVAVGAIAALGLVVACGPAADDAQPPGTLSAPVDRTFTDATELPNWAATASHVVGFATSNDQDAPGPAEPPRFAAAPLTGGDRFDLGAPDADGVFFPLAIAGWDDAALILGRDCASLEVTAERPVCEGPLAAHRVDPADRTWSEVPLDDVADGSDVYSVRALQPTGDGWLFAATVSTEDPAAATIAFVVEGDTARSVAPPLPTFAEGCLVDDELLALTKLDGTVGLLVAGPSTGPTELPLPDGIDVGHDGVAVHLVCVGSRVLVSSASADPDEPDPTVFAWDGSAWERRDDLVPDGALVASATSSSPGTAVVEWLLSDRTTALQVMDPSLAVLGMRPGDGQSYRWRAQGPDLVSSELTVLTLADLDEGEPS